MNTERLRIGHIPSTREDREFGSVEIAHAHHPDRVDAYLRVQSSESWGLASACCLLTAPQWRMLAAAANGMAEALERKAAGVNA